MKREELRYYKLPGTVGDYQLDHLISLSLGGSPYDTRNLWMQPEAVRDDKLEAKWHRDLCAGPLTLRGRSGPSLPTSARTAERLEGAAAASRESPSPLTVKR